jgi:drug/metabolite transporter (DMT)-like permease
MIQRPAKTIPAMSPPVPASRYAGPLFMLASSMMFSTLWLLIKLLGPPFHVWDIAIYRLGGGGLVLFLLFARSHDLFRPSRPVLMLVRGVVGSIAFILLVMAVQRLPFSTTMVFFYSFPAFSALCSTLLFRDRIGAGEVLCLVTAIAGLAVLFDFQMTGSVTGQVMAVGAAVFAGLTISLIKKLRETHGSVIIYFYLCLVGTLMALGPFLADPHLPQRGQEWWIVAAILLTSIGAQLLMNHGFQYCSSWEGGLLMTSEVLFSTLFGILLLGEAVGWRFWAGAALIVCSAAALNIQQRGLLRAKPKVARPHL